MDGSETPLGPRSRKPKQRRQSRLRDRVFAGMAARLQALVARLRGRRPSYFEPDPPDNRDEPDDGGLAASGVRTLPPDR